MTSFPPAALTQSPPRELRPPWDDYPSAHPLEIHPPRDDQLPPVPADAIAPARAPAAVGRRTLPPSARAPTRRGPTSFPPASWRKLHLSSSGHREDGNLPPGPA